MLECFRAAIKSPPQQLPLELVQVHIQSILLPSSSNTFEHAAQTREKFFPDASLRISETVLVRKIAASCSNTMCGSISQLLTSRYKKSSWHMVVFVVVFLGNEQVGSIVHGLVIKINNDIKELVPYPNVLEVPDQAKKTYIFLISIKIGSPWFLFITPDDPNNSILCYSRVVYRYNND
jgi:hypothetical protein